MRAFDYETGRLMQERVRLHAEMEALERQLTVRLGSPVRPVSPVRYVSPVRHVSPFRHVSPVRHRSPPPRAVSHTPRYSAIHAVAPPAPLTPAPRSPRLATAPPPASPRRALAVAEVAALAPRPVTPYASAGVLPVAARPVLVGGASPRQVVPWSPRFSAAYEAAVTESERRRLYDAYYLRHPYHYNYPVAVSPRVVSPVHYAPPVSPYRAAPSSPMGKLYFTP